MNRLLLSALYSFIFTASGTAFYYLIGLVVTISQGGSVSEFIWNTFVGAIMCFGFCTYVFYELHGAIERMNQRPRDDDDKKDPPAPPTE